MLDFSVFNELQRLRRAPVAVSSQSPNFFKHRIRPSGRTRFGFFACLFVGYFSFNTSCRVTNLSSQFGHGALVRCGDVSRFYVSQGCFRPTASNQKLGHAEVDASIIRLGVDEGT